MNATNPFQSYNIPQKAQKAPNSPWAEQINLTLEFMGENKFEFKKWCGKLRGFKENPGIIYMIRKEASGGDNPRALFHWLLKNKYNKQWLSANGYLPTKASGDKI